MTKSGVSEGKTVEQKAPREQAKVFLTHGEK